MTFWEPIKHFCPFHDRYLSAGNLRDANCLMDEIKKQVESKQLEFPQSDLIQFIIYLLQT